MSGACPIVTGPDELVTGLFALADCRVDLLARSGFLGLSGSTLYAMLVTGLLTILVAVQGYRMLFGIGPSMPDVVETIFRIGLALALTGSWATYDTVIGRVALRGPGEIAGLALPGAGLGGEGVALRLQTYYDAIRTAPQPPAPSDDTPPSIRDARADAGHDGRRLTSDTLGMAGTTQERDTAACWFVAGAVGPLLALRVAIAMLLALGPLAIVGVLFESTIGIFAAWLQTMAGMGLAWVAITAAVALELEALEGLLTTAINAQSYAIPGVLPVIVIFVLVKLALLFAILRVMNGRHLRQGLRSLWPWVGSVGSASGKPNGRDVGSAASNAHRLGLRPVHMVPFAPAAPQGRVSAISAALETSVRRERGAAQDDIQRSSGDLQPLTVFSGPGSPAYGTSTHRRPARMRMKNLT